MYCGGWGGRGGQGGREESPEYEVDKLGNYSLYKWNWA